MTVKTYLHVECPTETRKVAGSTPALATTHLRNPIKMSSHGHYLRVNQLLAVGLNAKNRLHTAPPLPAFIHCAHEAVQPPLVAPAQFKSLSSIPTQLPDAGKATLCIMSGGNTMFEPDEVASRLMTATLELPWFVT